MAKQTKRRRTPTSESDYIKGALRRIWGWNADRKKAKRRAEVAKNLYRCEKCGTNPLPRTEVEIDHVVSVESTTGWDGWDKFISRLFCPADGLQVICNPCHWAKSAQENQARRDLKEKE